MRKLLVTTDWTKKREYKKSIVTTNRLIGRHASIGLLERIPGSGWQCAGRVLDYLLHLAELGILHGQVLIFSLHLVRQFLYLLLLGTDKTFHPVLDEFFLLLAFSHDSALFAELYMQEKSAGGKKKMEGRLEEEVDGEGGKTEWEEKMREVHLS